MELSTILNAESSVHKLLCLRVDVAMLASTLANGGSQDPFLVPENMLDKFEDDEAKVHVLERHRDYLELKLRLKEQQQQRRDDLKSRLENKGSICAVGHDLKTNQNTTGLPGSLRDETRESRPDCVQDQTPEIGPESRPSQTN